MYKVKKALFFNLLTPMHVGGSYEASVVDQPIQRESHTGFPKVEASSLKGSLRHAFRKNGVNAKTINMLFGSEESDTDSGFTSSMAFSDVRLLFFPVRSAKGVFAYVTCPMVLKRFFKDVELVGVNVGEDGKEIDVSTKGVVTNCSKISLGQGDKKEVLLEEYVFEVEKEQEDRSPFSQFLIKLNTYLQMGEVLQEHAIVVSDDAFSDLVQMSTEIITRTRISHETGIVEKGALFNEEYLPSDAIMYSLLFISDGFQAKNDDGETDNEARNLAHNFMENLPGIFQVGGNATLGKGFVECKVAPKEDCK